MIRTSMLLSLSVLLGAALSPGAIAQQIIGTPGSPSASTMTRLRHWGLISFLTLVVRYFSFDVWSKC
jgi:hypothetical protein